ncbi:hypothetical protein [Methanolapillus ohkumae]|uniref:hypothetical protein n=1 Tax=Methanolapillus ohkumae TaxID=3028298 RepID=UPI0030B87B5F
MFIFCFRIAATVYGLSIATTICGLSIAAFSINISIPYEQSDSIRCGNASD